MADSFLIPISTNGCPTTDQVRKDARAQRLELPAQIEIEIVAALMRPLAVGETHAVAAEQRERALLAIFFRLTPAEAMALGRRLDFDQANDSLAVAFRRITSDRRRRLRGFLADTRRRLGVLRGGI